MVMKNRQRSRPSPRVREDLVQFLLLPDLFSVFEFLHRYSATAHFTLMRAFMVVVVDPLIQVALQARQIARFFANAT